jgi:PTS system fructose-specific IIC component
VGKNDASRSVGGEIKKHVLTGISYMIPAIVMGGLLLAFAKMLGGVNVAQQPDTIPGMMNTAGTVAMGLVVPVLSAYIAFSVGDKPGIAPGLLIGTLAVQIKAGFIGGIIGGLIVGYCVVLIRNYVKVPKPVVPLMPILIIPLLAGLMGSIFMLVIIGPPIASASAWAAETIKSMNTASKFLFGAIIGGLMGFDMGGPVNKVGSTVANGLLADGVMGPAASKICASMTPPLGVGLSVFAFARNKFTPAEREAAKVAIPLGLCQVTEGVLPFAAADPFRVIPSSSIGSAVAGGLCMLWGVESPLPHGGSFSVPLMLNPGGFIIALIVGSLVTGIILSVIRPKIPVGLEVEEEAVAEDFDVVIKTV